MTPGEHIACLKEGEWGKLWQIVKEHSAHVKEGDQPGGFRDQLTRLNLEMSDVKKNRYFTAIVGGIIGALIGSGSSEAIVMLVKWITGMK